VEGLNCILCLIAQIKIRKLKLYSILLYPVTNASTYSGGSETEDTDQEQYKVIRIRHYFEFDTPLILKRTEEITFCNKSNAELKNIVYNAREFLPHLNIYDSNGEQLIFHGNPDDCEPDINGDDHESDESDEDSESFPIIIEFPKTNPVSIGDIRTITLKYINDFGLSDDKKLSFIELPLGESTNFYLYIKKLDEYITEIDPFIEAKKEDEPEVSEYFPLSDLDEYDFIDTENTPTYFRMTSSVAIPNCTLIVVVSYEMTYENVLWFNGGIVIGVGSFVTNLGLIISDVKTFLPCIITLGALANTYLILTRGWIFTKNPVEKVLLIPYTSYYFLLILIIFLEVFVACFFVLMTNYTYPNVNITLAHRVFSNLVKFI